MTGCPATLTRAIFLFAGGLLCALLLLQGVAASPLSPQREIIPLNAEAFAQPEYVQALANELEKEEAANRRRPGQSRDGTTAWDAYLPRAVAELKSQDDGGHLTRNSQNDFDSADYGNNKKFASHRTSESLNSPKSGFSESVIYPSEIMSLSNKKRNFDEIDRSGFSGFSGKRNFDEIDRSGFSGFNRKRNFDEIDRNGFSGFSKRNFDEIDRNGFSGFNKRNFDEIDRSGFAGFNRKRNFDEIDRNGFSGFSKRNLDEIDRNGFSGFSKRNFDEIDRSGFSGFNRKRNLDEIDRSGFSGFNRKRNFDEIDRSGVPGFAKRSVASRSKLAAQRRR